MSQNYKLISCLAKKGQDQHVKLSPQKAYFILRSLFSQKNIVTPPAPPLLRQISMTGTLYVPPVIHFYLIPLFSKFGTESCPPRRKGKTDTVKA